jgi:hypothetical protein
MSIVLLGQENKVRAVNAFEVRGVSIKRVKKVNDIRRGGGPSCFEERGDKAIRARADIGVHAAKGALDL